jgi:transaldolase/glucose-6-phosphate isomerase
MLNQIKYSLPSELENDLEQELAASEANDKTARIWAKDASVWTGDDEVKWLGWLDIVDRELAGLQKYRDLQADIKSAGFTDVLLMGMGGSSLCPEVLSITFGKKNFHVLDSTVPSQIKAIEGRIDLETTLFIVASKSGSTLEPNCFKQYFFHRLSQRVGRENAGKQFIAITDPGSKMQQVAEADGFRHIFFGDPEIGGRFSALSAFGLVAAAAMNLDVSQVLQSASEMGGACSESGRANPGALLGTILGVSHKHGRDKLTIFTSPEIYDVGAWLEQLIAESTGKNGKAIIPVDREPIQSADAYGHDRLFVYMKLAGGEPDAEMMHEFEQLEALGHPVVTITLNNTYDLGQEFFRWEFATAVAGSIMGIHPFNQPDVEAAKIEARKLTDEYEEKGELPPETPFYEEDGVKLFFGEDYAAELTGSVEEKSLAAYLEAHLLHLQENDYFAVLGYIEMNEENEMLLQAIREKVLESNPAATCLGFGPRFLHSTGQAYKGGPDSGVFLQITADDARDLPVPGQKASFGVVKAAQARGDFDVLTERGRRALRVHLKGDLKPALAALDAAISEALN